MTPQQLKQVMIYASEANANKFAQPLTDAMNVFGIGTPIRQAAFLAQLAHESGSLMYVKEIASGSAYEGRADLGNHQPGDGVRYKGRGLIQVTGRANYMRAAQALGMPLVDRPEMLEEPGPACMSAGWFWSMKNLNELADKDKFGEITKRINGGYNGLDDRIEHWLRARRALGV